MHSFLYHLASCRDVHVKSVVGIWEAALNVLLKELQQQLQQLLLLSHEARIVLGDLPLRDSCNMGEDLAF